MKTQFSPLSLCSMIGFNYKVRHHFLQRTLCMEYSFKKACSIFNVFYISMQSVLFYLLCNIAM